MDAIILAAGKGTRMRPLTNHTPKPLLDLQGEPILGWGLRTVRPVADRVVIVAGYLKEQVADYMASQDIFSDYALVEQLPEPRGTGHALQCCAPYLQSDSFIVLNGDDLYSAEAIARLAAAPLGLLTMPRMEQSSWGVAVTNEQGHLLRLHEKPAEGTYPLPIQASVGAYKLDKRIFDYELPLSPRGEYELTDYLSYMASQYPVELVETEFWYPIGTPEALEAAQTMDLKSAIFYSN